MAWAREPYTRPFEVVPTTAPVHSFVRLFHYYISSFSLEKCVGLLLLFYFLKSHATWSPRALKALTCEAHVTVLFLIY